MCCDTMGDRKRCYENCVKNTLEAVPPLSKVVVAVVVVVVVVVVLPAVARIAWLLLLQLLQRSMVCCVCDTTECATKKS